MANPLVLDGVCSTRSRCSARGSAQMAARENGQIPALQVTALPIRLAGGPSPADFHSWLHAPPAKLRSSLTVTWRTQSITLTALGKDHVVLHDKLHGVAPIAVHYSGKDPVKEVRQSAPTGRHKFTIASVVIYCPGASHNGCEGGRRQGGRGKTFPRCQGSCQLHYRISITRTGRTWRSFKTTIENVRFKSLYGLQHTAEGAPTIEVPQS